jgi:hypothetical protein
VSVTERTDEAEREVSTLELFFDLAALATFPIGLVASAPWQLSVLLVVLLAVILVHPRRAIVPA